MRTGGLRRRLVAGSVVAGVTVLAGAAFAIVHGLDQAVLGEVQVFLDARSLHCADPADVTIVVSDGIAIPALRDAAGLDCTLSVVVRNTSDRDVGVQRVVFAGFGPESEAGLETDHAFTQGLSPAPVEDGTETLFDYAHDPRTGGPYVVAAGSSTRMLFHLRAHGCQRPGDYAAWTGDPVVVVAVGTATRDVALSGPGLAAAGTSTAVCR